MRPRSGVVEIGYKGHGGMHFPSFFMAHARGLALRHILVLAEGSYSSILSVNINHAVEAMTMAVASCNDV